MRQQVGNRKQEAAKGPVRGTQSFVGVMGAVWRRPSLTGLEIWWRWAAGVVFLAAVYAAFGGYGVEQAGLDTTALRAATVFQPVAGIQTLEAAVGSVWSYARPNLWWLPVVVLVWLLASSFGRTLVLRRLDPTLHRRRGSLLVLGALRAAILAAVWGFWAVGVRWALRFSVTQPAGRGEEPSLVAFFAFLICGTLALYVAWAAASWPLQLAPLLAMREGLGVAASLRAAFGAGAVRGKLVEINLVMHIVKLALIVLAMVLSASPLAFQTVATQQFFVVWWMVAVLLYLAASDYFHVVRAAAYLALWAQMRGGMAELYR